MVRVIYGMGPGKSTAAIGSGIKAISAGKTVYMVQFLKGNSEKEVLDVLGRLEPEMKIFRFEKYGESFDMLGDRQRKEELINIKNGISFAKKVLSTNGCDVLILDELLGLVDKGIMPEEDLEKLIEDKPEEMEIILTGQILNERFRQYADVISRVDYEKQ